MMNPIGLPIDSSHANILQDVFPGGVVAIDLETTGLSPLSDHIIELGAVKLGPKGSAKFETLINPLTPIPQNTIDIHGITDDMVSSGPTIEQVLPQLKSFIGHCPIFAHNASFDMGFMLKQFHNANISPPDCLSYCTVKLARAILPNLINHKLATLASHFSIEIPNHHRAFDDSVTCFKLLGHLLDQCPDHLKRQKALERAYIFNCGQFDSDSSFALPKRFQSLIELIKKKEIIEIEYMGGSMTSPNSRFRPIKLVGLLPMPRGAMLHAQCLISGTYKSFALKKIKNYSLPNEKSKARYQRELEELNTTHRREREKLAAQHKGSHHGQED